MYYVNVDTYYERIEKAARRFYLKLTTISAKQDPGSPVQAAEDIVLLVPTEFNSKLPSLLVAAGFHGDEPGGYMGIMAFLEATHKYWGGNVNVSFMPIMNVDGVRHGKRNGLQDQRTNGGYIHDQDIPSMEGQILLRHIKMLETLAQDGFLTLHEDDRNDMFYVYAYTNREGQTDDLLESILKTGKLYFKVQQSGNVVSPGNPNDSAGPVRNGVILNLHDGSFEDRMFHSGARHCICTETPANHVRLDMRIQANASIIATAVDYFVAKSK